MPKAAKNQVAERLDEAEELLCAGLSPGRVERALAAKYKITPRQARTYMGRVYERWQKQSAEDAPHRRETLVRMVQQFYVKSVGAKQYNAAAQALSLLAKIQGAFVPVQDAKRAERLEKLGPPPADPASALVWAQSAMLFGLEDVLTNPSLDPEKRLRWISEIGGRIGMTHSKALVQHKLAEVAQRVLPVSTQAVDDEFEELEASAWPDAARFGVRDAAGGALSGRGAAVSEGGDEGDAARGGRPVGQPPKGVH